MGKHVNTNQQKSGVHTLILNEMYLKMMCKSIHSEDMIILNNNVHNKTYEKLIKL